jgi:hypothetical protein
VCQFQLLGLLGLLGLLPLPLPRQTLVNLLTICCCFRRVPFELPVFNGEWYLDKILASQQSFKVSLDFWDRAPGFTLFAGNPNIIPIIRSLEDLLEFELRPVSAGTNHERSIRRQTRTTFVRKVAMGWTRDHHDMLICKVLVDRACN